jgi:hypothetical protein
MNDMMKIYVASKIKDDPVMSLALWMQEDEKPTLKAPGMIDTTPLDISQTRVRLTASDLKRRREQDDKMEMEELERQSAIHLENRLFLMGGVRNGQKRNTSRIQDLSSRAIKKNDSKSPRRAVEVLFLITIVIAIFIVFGNLLGVLSLV